MATDPRESAADVERRLIDIVRSVKRRVTIPGRGQYLPVLLVAFHLAGALDEEGADGLVLFNRFYQPDIDPEMLLAVPRLHFSTSDELLLRVVDRDPLRPDSGVARRDRRRPYGHGRAQGDHGRRAGGPDGCRAPEEAPHLALVRRELAHWLEEHEYDRCGRRKAV